MDTKQQRRTCIAMGRVIPSLRGVFCVQSGWLDVCRWKQLLRDVSSSVREVKVVPSICVGQERLRIWAIVVRVVGDLCHGSLLLFTWRGGTLADKVHKKKPSKSCHGNIRFELHCPKSWIEGLDHGHGSPAPAPTVGLKVAVWLEIAIVVLF